MSKWWGVVVVVDDDVVVVVVAAAAALTGFRFHFVDNKKNVVTIFSL